MAIGVSNIILSSLRSARPASSTPSTRRSPSSSAPLPPPTHFPPIFHPHPYPTPTPTHPLPLPTVYPHPHPTPTRSRLIQYITSGPVVGLELVADSAVSRWRTLLGPTDSFRARAEAPDSLRAKFGADGTDNACHGSDAPDSAAAELAFFFGPGSPVRAACRADGSTALLLVKPHALLAGSAGLIVDQVQSQFAVVGAGLFAVDRTNSASNTRGPLPLCAPSGAPSGAELSPAGCWSDQPPPRICLRQLCWSAPSALPASLPPRVRTPTFSPPAPVRTIEQSIEQARSSSRCIGAFCPNTLRWWRS